MRCLLRRGLLFVCCAVVSFCVKADPEITVDTPVHSFGRHLNTEKVHHKFVIKNIGTSPLEIGKVHACCGSSVNILNKTVEPGGETSLAINLSLSGRKGELNKSFYVSSNDPDRKLLRLQLKGTAIPLIDIQPNPVHFDKVPEDSELTKVVSIACHSSISFKITDVICESQHFSVKYKGLIKGKHLAEVRTVPPLSRGVTTAKAILITDNKKHPRIELLLRTVVASDIVIVPREIVLTAQPDDPNPVTRYVALRSRTKQKFNITNIKVPENNIKTESTPLKSGGYRLKLTNISPVEEINGKELIITTDHSSAKTVILPLRIVSRKKINS